MICFGCSRSVELRAVIALMISPIGVACFQYLIAFLIFFSQGDSTKYFLDQLDRVGRPVSLISKLGLIIIRLFATNIL